MFYFKMIVLFLIFFVTVVQLFAIGGNFFVAIKKRANEFVPTSTTEAIVVEVQVPKSELSNSSSEGNPGKAEDQGKVIIQFKDAEGITHESEFFRSSAVGRTEYYDKKVGDRFSMEIPDSKNGHTSIPEKLFWAHIARILIIFSGILLATAGILRFL